MNGIGDIIWIGEFGRFGGWKPLNVRISWAPSKRQHREKYFLRSKYEWSNITIITSSVVFQSCKSRQQHNHVFPVIVHFIHCCCIIWLFCSTTRLVQSFWNWCRRNNSSGFSGPDTVFFCWNRSLMVVDTWLSDWASSLFLWCPVMEYK